MSIFLPLVPDLTLPKVKVYPLNNRISYRIEWDPVQGAEGYRVYAGFDPYHIRSLISGDQSLPSNQTSFEFTLCEIPPTQVIYFWVSYNIGTVVTFIDEFGSYDYRTIQLSQFNNNHYSPTTVDLMNHEMKWYFEEIRRRSKAVMEDVTEEVIVYIKQWKGLSDKYTQDELGLDPNYQTMTRADDTYGVGFYPGYFPGINVRMRFGSLPPSLYEFQPTGLRPVFNVDTAWTCWEPLLHEHDLIFRISTGRRYEIAQTSVSNIRGIPLIQRINLSSIDITSPLYKINDDDLWTKWNGINKIDYMRIGFNVIGNASNSINYMIFK